MAEIERKFPQEALSEIAYPSANIAYLLVSQEGKTTAALGRWGFQASGNRPVYNARQETVLSKGMFQGCFAESRCIVPSHGFYEWDEEHRKHIFLPKGKGLFYFAALYRLRGDGVEITILTTHSQGDMERIHHRMPLILEETQLRAWLYDRQAAEVLLAQGCFLMEEALAEEE